LQSDSNKFSRRADRNRKMATEGHGCMVERRTTAERKDEMDKELTEIRERMEELALRVQQNAKHIGCMNGP
jgi:hypothetical protein